MLKDTLYVVESMELSEGLIKATLSVNKDHPIFAGHFPGQPVLPGACMLQMLKEILAEALNIPVRLKKAMHVKFLGVIDPGVARVLNLKISYIPGSENILNVVADLMFADEICFKFKGEFIKLSP